MNKIKITGNFKIEGLDFIERIEQPLEYLEFELNPHAYKITLINAKSIITRSKDDWDYLFSKESIAILLYLKEEYPSFVENRRIHQITVNSNPELTRKRLKVLSNHGMIELLQINDCSILTQLGISFIEGMYAIKEGKI